MTETIEFVDSHTAGEPTRVVVAGGPDLGVEAVGARQDLLRQSHDRLRTAVVDEPRGSDALVGALLLRPCDPNCVAGVLFFNNAGYLGMCGHGMIGVVKTLQWLGKIGIGQYQIETSVGKVTTNLHADGRVSVTNVPSYRLAHDVVLADVAGLGTISGDVAWGGNWFFLCSSPGLEVEIGNIDRLTAAARAIRLAAHSAGYTQVDHIELLAAWRHEPTAPPTNPIAAGGAVAGRARSFVLCPGFAYDRSPCGTGTSAKLACLAADGKLQPGEIWLQQSVIGTEFMGSFTWDRNDESPHRILPTITGSAFITAHGKLVLDESDPFRWGIPRPHREAHGTK